MTSYETEHAKTAGHQRSPHWSSVRAAWLKDHPACCACGGKEHVEVHHIRPFHLHPERELDTTNFVTMCEQPGHDCHFRDGHGYNWQDINPDVVVDAAHDLARVLAIRKAV